MAGYTGAAGSNEGNWKGGGGSLGLTTGTRWSGNTAYGPSGGMASGYASRDAQSLRNAGMGPSMGSYGQFMTPQGSPMFSGALGGSSFFGRNAPQALSQALRAARNNPAMATGPQPASGPVTQPPLPPYQQPPMPMPSAFNQPWLNKISNFYNYIQRNYPVAPAAPRIGGMVGGRGMVGYDADVEQRRAPGSWGGVDIQNGINGMNGH